MKRILAALTIAAGCTLAATGCAPVENEATASHTPAVADTTFATTTTPAVPPQTTKTYTVDDAYIAVLDSKGIFYSSEENAIALAHLACDAIDDGATLLDLMAASAESTYSLEDAGFIVGAGIGAYCPENEWIFE